MNKSRRNQFLHPNICKAPNILALSGQIYAAHIFARKKFNICTCMLRICMIILHSPHRFFAHAGGLARPVTYFRGRSRMQFSPPMQICNHLPFCKQIKQNLTYIYTNIFTYIFTNICTYNILYFLHFYILQTSCFTICFTFLQIFSCRHAHLQSLTVLYYN